MISLVASHSGVQEEYHSRVKDPPQQISDSFTRRFEEALLHLNPLLSNLCHLSFLPPLFILILWSPLISLYKNLVCVDDIDLVAESPHQLQELTDSVYNSSKGFGLQNNKCAENQGTEIGKRRGVRASYIVFVPGRVNNGRWALHKEHQTQGWPSISDVWQIE